MLLFLHRLSAFFFYVLGTSFFVAYILLRNDLQAEWAARWLLWADLPLALTTVLYGGLSFYRSLTTPGKTSRMLAVAIAVPLLALFVLLVLLNFMPLWLAK